VNSNKPIISVCIPVFNGEKNISKNLDSLLSQNFKNFEILISNNKSTDKTLEICNFYKKKFDHIKIFNQKKKLPVFQNFKFLIKRSKGDYIMWLASHHKISKNFLKENLKILKKNNDFVASMGVDYFDKFKDPVDQKKFTFNKDIYHNLLIFFNNCWRTHGLFYSLIRRGVVFKIIPSLKHYLASDWIFMISLIFQGKIYRSLNTSLILGNEGNSSQTTKPNYITKNFKSFFPLHYYNKHFFLLLKKKSNLTFFQKINLSFILLLLNLRYLISILKIND
jgi:glycosyltransferase involved in cell wall biosynthesis